VAAELGKGAIGLAPLFKSTILSSQFLALKYNLHVHEKHVNISTDIAEHFGPRPGHPVTYFEIASAATAV